MSVEILPGVFVWFEQDNVAVEAIQKTYNHRAIDGKNDEVSELSISLTEERDYWEGDQEVDGDDQNCIDQ